MGKKHGPEEVIGKLREAEIVLAELLPNLGDGLTDQAAAWA